MCGHWISEKLILKNQIDWFNRGKYFFIQNNFVFVFAQRWKTYL